MKNYNLKVALILLSVTTSLSVNAYTIRNESNSNFQYAKVESPDAVATIKPNESVRFDHGDIIYISKGDGHSFIDRGNANYFLSNNTGNLMNSIYGFANDEGTIESWVVMADGFDPELMFLHLNETNLYYSIFIDGSYVQGGIKMSDVGKLKKQNHRIRKQL